ncbi:N-acetylmuramoyl-L-alanine amidase [Thomasclavelia cocleata]|uniref:N-acetylmuramoyl-L-alanine amidase n=1 Tax=Thomasclavelia cocleata TaxID=69824 RepID=UPI00257126DC|nr:N-acetylmuramoyl-L-alanine amidase [Thomasclavelia cocleata]
MKILNIHGGHNLKVPGANKLFNEVTEDRKVKDLVIGKMKSLGYTVYDCTDDSGKTQNENLKNIVSKCNDHTVDLDVSIHFNASDGQGHGVEVLQYSNKTQEVAQNICNAIAQLGFKNRGVKERKDLYVLKHTKAPAILIECCFCDSAIDTGLYNCESMANAIIKGVTGKAVNETVVQSVPNTGYKGDSIVDYLNSVGKESSYDARKKYAKQYGIVNYSGTAEQNIMLLNIMRGTGNITSAPANSYYPAFNNVSIVDGLKSIGIDCSKANRARIAMKNGIDNYTGSAEQNNKLCVLAKQGKLIKV